MRRKTLSGGSATRSVAVILLLVGGLAACGCGADLGSTPTGAAEKQVPPGAPAGKQGTPNPAAPHGPGRTPRG